MTKVAVYVMVRFLFDLAGEPAWWWGAVLLALGTVSAVVGLLHAVLDDDLKRVLAYSTVENIGVVVIGLGLSLIFRAAAEPGIASLALAAALLHAFNHSLFKTLLFYGAGAVVTATGHRQLDRLGGLIHRMPATALLFLIGAAAISALPPLNGFVSEWLTFQAILNAPHLDAWGLKVGVAVAGAGLALSVALAAACFVRLFGTTFLGRARSVEAARSSEIGGWMIAAMAISAVACIAVGVLPMLALTLVEPVTLEILGEGVFGDGRSSWFRLAPAAAIGDNGYGGVILLSILVIVAITGAGLVHRFASNRVRRAEAWGAGHPDAGPSAQYTADGFSQPIRRVFGGTLFGIVETVDAPEPGDTRPARFTVAARDFVWAGLYAPIIAGVGWLADRCDRSQFLTIRRYLSMMFAALVALLCIVAVTQ